MTIKRRVIALALGSFVLLAAGQVPADTQIDPNTSVLDAESSVQNTEISAADLAAIDLRTAQLRAAAVPLAAGDTITADLREPAIVIDDATASRPARLQKLIAGAQAPTELNDELKCLATAVYFEARGEPLEGQLAVAQVILARVASGRFASTICGVVYQPGQFTFAHSRLPSTGSTDWKVAQAIAVVAASDSVPEVAPRAISFHAARLSPNWGNLRKVSQIGNHVFYR